MAQSPQPRGAHGRLASGTNGSAAAPLSTTRRMLLLCGVIGPSLFILAFLIEGATRPGYNAVQDTVSALENGPLGWTQVTNFIVFGCFMAGFAVALRQALRGGVGAFWAPVMEGVVALGLIGDGVFTRDPLHTLCDIVTFTAALIVCLILARRFAGDDRWRGWAAYSLITAALLVALLITFGAAMSHHGPAGLFEKLAVLVRAAWTVAFAARLLAGVSLAPRVQSAPHPGA